MLYKKIKKMDILTIWRKISVIYLGVSEFIRSTFMTFLKLLCYPNSIFLDRHQLFVHYPLSRFQAYRNRGKLTHLSCASWSDSLP